jgi:dihydroceramide fatty acyl 2-hydroxylase
MHGMSESLELPAKHRATAETTANLKASPRLFEHPLLDKLSRAHWLLPPVFYSPFVAILAWLSLGLLRITIIVPAVLLGYLGWTLLEYFGHRYLFHARLPGKFGARVHFLVHGVHHDHPNDPLRLVMPPLMSAPIMAGAFSIIYALTDFQPVAYPVMLGFMMGYVLYDLVHYYVHHNQPKTLIVRALRERHMRHHFHDETRGFGVSAPWWDTVFRTTHVRPRNLE